MCCPSSFKSLLLATCTLCMSSPPSPPATCPFSLSLKSSLHCLQLNPDLQAHISTSSFPQTSKTKETRSSNIVAMGDRGHTHQLQVHTQHHPQYTDKSRFAQQHGTGHLQSQGPSTTKVLTVMGLLPVGGTLLTLAGLIFAGTMTGLAVTFPLFVLFSPVLVPAALAIGLAVTGILTSGAFGLTAISSLSWVLSYLRGTVPGQIHQAKRGMQDMTEYVGGKTKEVGETIQSKAQEAKRSDTAGTGRNTTTTATA